MTAYWLIERTIDGVQYWWMGAVGKNSDWMASDRWTIDANKARHYDSKADAKFVMGNQMPGCVATEHINIADAGARELAAKFHETYERLAPSFGYETRPDAKAFDADSANGKLMTAVCGEIKSLIETKAFQAGFQRGLAEGIPGQD